MMKNMYRNDEALTIRLKMPGTGKTVTSARFISDRKEASTALSFH